MIQGDFFNWPPPEFAKCWPVRNRFRKNLRVPDWPPLYDQKKSKCLRTPMWFSYLQDLGGASRGIFGGGQFRDIPRGGPVKKITLYKWIWTFSTMVPNLITIWSHTYFVDWLNNTSCVEDVKCERTTIFPHIYAYNTDTSILQVSNCIPQLYCGAQIRTPNNVLDVFGHIFERAKYSQVGCPWKDLAKHSSAVLMNSVNRTPPVKSYDQIQILTNFWLISSL